MNKIYTMAAGFLLCAGLASCEMKEEIFGKGEVPSETGKVELGVSVDDKTNAIITKAAADADGDIQGSDVNPAEYPVIFTHQEADYTKEYIYEDIEDTEVTLPIGKYVVESHTPGELEKQMTYPYYGGNVELEVSKDVISDAKVICTMQNSRILLTYGAEFSSKFSDWTITIDDGSDKTLVFTNEMGLNPDPVYWYFGTECAEIKINVTANNGTIRESRTITKPDGASNPNWTGGDALTITMLPGEVDPDNPSGIVGSGIDIKVEAFFTTSKNEEVTVSIDGEETTDPEEPENPGEGDDTPTTDGPSIVSDYLEPGISYQLKADNETMIGNPANAWVTVSAPAKLKNVYVKIVGGNKDFDDAIKAIATEDGKVGFQIGSGVDIIDINEYGEGFAMIGGLLSPLPTRKETEYRLDLSNFFPMMNMMGVTVDDYGKDYHEFIITVIDQNDKSETATLKVTINPAPAE